MTAIYQPLCPSPGPGMKVFFVTRLLEMDDAYLGATKPGKRGRGASGKAKVLVAVETPGDQPHFAALRQVPQAGRHDLKGRAQECLLAAATVRTDGWQAYRVLAEVPHRHEP